MKKSFIVMLGCLFGASIMVESCNALISPDETTETPQGGQQGGQQGDQQGDQQNPPPPPPPPAAPPPPPPPGNPAVRQIAKKVDPNSKSDRQLRQEKTEAEAAEAEKERIEEAYKSGKEKLDKDAKCLDAYLDAYSKGNLTEYLEAQKESQDAKYIRESLRKDLNNVTVEVLELKRNENLSVISDIINREKALNNIQNDDEIAVFFDYDNTITRDGVFLKEHEELLNTLTNSGIDWCVITASTSDGPDGKYGKMKNAGIKLELDPDNKEIIPPVEVEYIPSILTYKDKGNNSSEDKFDLANIKYISCGDNTLFAALPKEKENNRFVDNAGKIIAIEAKENEGKFTIHNPGGFFVYNDRDLVTRYKDADYIDNGYQKPAAMRYFLKKHHPKKLIIVVDDTARNIKDFADDAKAKLLGNVADGVKLVAIWYEPTQEQYDSLKKHGVDEVEFRNEKYDDVLRTKKYGMKTYQKTEVPTPAPASSEGEFTEAQLNGTISKGKFNDFKEAIVKIRGPEGAGVSVVERIAFGQYNELLQSLGDPEVKEVSIRNIVNCINKNTASTRSKIDKAAVKRALLRVIEKN